MPCSRACSSVRPNEATFGAQKVARGMSTVLDRVRRRRPAASSTAMMPSSEALCASAGPWTRSPIAYTPSTAVRRRAVDLDQAVVVELDAGVLEPERLDVRPAARGDDQPVDLGLLVAVGEGDACRRGSSRSPPACRCGSACSACASVRPATLEMSASSVGSTRSSASNSSTSVPSRPYAEAISAPDAPAPTTASRCGSSSSAHASSVPMTRPPNSVPGIGLGTEPVARITSSPRSRRRRRARWRPR